ncbi:MAG TPA: hypothetical protein VI256_06640 [Roseiarcus sp.]
MSTSAVAVLALIAAPGAKAKVVETFHLSGSFGNISGPLVSFTGTVNLEFSNNFATETLKSITISVQGRPTVFNQSVSLSVIPSVGIIDASNSAGDTLALWFAAPQSGTWAGFNSGDVSFGEVLFGNVPGVLLGATGKVKRDLSNPVILAAPILDPPPPIIDPPPPIIDPPPPILDPPPPTLAVPELSTWAMLLLGLMGLGLAAQRRRALGFLGGKA